MPRNFIVEGQVIDIETRNGIPELGVEAIDKDRLSRDDSLGKAITDRSGSFKIFYNKQDFQDDFRDSKPDIYLVVKDKKGDIVYTSKDNVRWNASRKERFIIHISTNLIEETMMKWDIEKSNEVKKQIAKNEELMKALSAKTKEVFDSFDIDLKGMSYIFEPRVFTMSKEEVPEMKMKSYASLTQVAMEDLIKKGKVPHYYEKVKIPVRPEPIEGIIDPEWLHILEKYRINERELVQDNPVPIKTSDILIKKIVGNSKLLNVLSQDIFKLLARHGIKFGDTQGCVLTPVVFETPVYAQLVGKVNDTKEIRGFGPQVIAESVSHGFKPVAGSIMVGDILVPSVSVDQMIWVGIPAPEMLFAQELLKQQIRI